MKKRITNSRKKVKQQNELKSRLRGSSSFLLIMALPLIAIFAILMTSAETKWLTKYKDETAPASQVNLTSTNPGGTCCDMGDGVNCTLVPGKDVTFRGETYGLLRSSILSGEKGSHIKYSGEVASNGQGVYLNQRSDTTSHSKAGPTCTADKDWYFRGVISEGTHFCWGVPDDQIILLCSTLNPPGKCDKEKATALWDAYFRKSDEVTPGIPDFIRYCYLPLDEAKVLAATDTADKGRPNLQLQTFTLAPSPVVTPMIASTSVASYLTPYCKPAIYLYPEENMPVHVRIFPRGELTVTIPKYPRTGWNAFAFIDGSVSVDNSRYDYLYYEAKIADGDIVKPDEGYVVAADELAVFLPELLKDLGLNTKERNQFTEYWLSALPSSAFYKVTVIPQSSLDFITPLAVFPTPQTVIRVTLYFESLDQFIHVTPPVVTPVSRNGFTVVEWGGMYKKDSKHPFTCLQ